MSKRSGETAGRKIYRYWKWRGFSYKSDLIAHDYMRRWVIETPLFMLRLHHILRGDSREHFHDHPMSFLSLILWGGYVEHTPKGSRTCRLGNLVFRRAEDLHYLELIGKSAWTLLVTGRYRRSWGFHTEDGFVVAGEYDAWLERRERSREDEMERKIYSWWFGLPSGKRPKSVTLLTVWRDDLGLPPSAAKAGDLLKIECALRKLGFSEYLDRKRGREFVATEMMLSAEARS